MGGNTGLTQTRNMSSSGIMGGHQSASQKLRLDTNILRFQLFNVNYHIRSIGLQIHI